MEKETYTYQEILLALYQEYINNQQMLQELTKYLYINPHDKIEDVSFCSQFEMYTKLPGSSKRQVIFDKKIGLEITEDLTALKSIKEYLLHLSGYGTHNRKLYYDVIKQPTGDYQISLTDKDLLVRINPQIEITNQKEFNELTTEILSTEFMNSSMREYGPRMPGGWYLTVAANLISLSGPNQRVSFWPQNNLVTFLGTKDYFEADSLLSEKIHKYYIDDSIIKLIVRNLNDSNLEMTIPEDGWKTIGKNNFMVEKQSTGLRLVRKK